MSPLERMIAHETFLDRNPVAFWKVRSLFIFLLIGTVPLSQVDRRAHRYEEETVAEGFCGAGQVHCSSAALVGRARKRALGKQEESYLANWVTLLECTDDVAKRHNPG
jgi:hypothetical protein